MKSNPYSSESIFSKEKNYFISNAFILIGHTCEFENKGDYKVINFLEKSIVIYKFKEKISAFTNLCSHRGTKIFTKVRGNSSFVCPYHAWSYDYRGIVKNVPYDKMAFNLDKKKIKLEEWILDFCGDFIFLKSKTNHLNLKSYLGVEFKNLSKISKKIYKNIDHQVYNWNANWKICVENSIDEYHAIFLHQTTFKNLLKLKPEYEIKENVMKMQMPVSKSYINKFAKINTYFNDLKNTYEHTMIFPYSSISTTMGNSYYIQNYLPIDTKNTYVTSSIYLPKISFKKNQKVETFFSNSCMKFNEQIFTEDKEICENIFNNIKNSNFRDIIGNLEYRIKIFRNMIKKI